MKGRSEREGTGGKVCLKERVPLCVTGKGKVELRGAEIRMR